MENNKQLVIVENNVPLADSRKIAEKLGVDHRSFMRLITEYLEEIEADFGKVRFQIASSGKTKQSQRYALLNENQTYTLMMYTQNTEQARACKRLLVRAFDEAKQQLLTLQSQHAALTEQQLVELEQTVRTEFARLDARLNDLDEKTHALHLDDTDRAIIPVNIYRLSHTITDLQSLVKKTRLQPGEAQEIRTQLATLTRILKEIKEALTHESQLHESLIDAYHTIESISELMSGDTPKQLEGPEDA